MKSGLYKLFTFSLVATFGVLAGAALAVAATTIGTNVTTTCLRIATAPTGP